MDPELAVLHAQIVTIAPRSGVPDVNQKMTYGTAVEFAARVELGTRLIKTADNRTIATQGVVYLVPNDWSTFVPTPQADLLTLPANYPNRVPPILDVKVQPDEDGSLYSIEVYF